MGLENITIREDQSLGIAMANAWRVRQSISTPKRAFRRSAQPTKVQGAYESVCTYQGNVGLIHHTHPAELPAEPLWQTLQLSFLSAAIVPNANRNSSSRSLLHQAPESQQVAMFHACVEPLTLSPP